MKHHHLLPLFLLTFSYLPFDFGCNSYILSMCSLKSSEVTKKRICLYIVKNIIKILIICSATTLTKHKEEMVMNKALFSFLITFSTKQDSALLTSSQFITIYIYNTNKKLFPRPHFFIVETKSAFLTSYMEITFKQATIKKV